MNQGQERFYNFILERVQEDKTDEAKELLSDSFNRQDEGRFTPADITRIHPQLIALLKPDKVDEVKAVMNQFAQSMGH